MKKICISTFLALIAICCVPFASADGSTDKNELETLYTQKNYGEVISRAGAILETDAGNACAAMYLGSAYEETLEFAKAIPYLEAAIANGKADSGCLARSECVLGVCYYMTGDRENAIASLNDSIACQADSEIVDEAKDLLKSINADSYFDDWITVGSEHFLFHFHPSFGELQRERFVQTREDAYGEVNRFFNSRPMKKIDFYVWDSDESAQRILGRPLGFTIPSLAVINSLYSQSTGHEITHALRYWMYPGGTATALIDEGTATYFNCSVNEEQEEERLRVQIRRGEAAGFDLRKMWGNNGAFRQQENSYVIGSSFVRYLIKQGGEEKFKELLEKETYDNAKAVYGDAIDQYIRDFSALYQPRPAVSPLPVPLACSGAAVLAFFLVLVLLKRKRRNCR